MSNPTTPLRLHLYTPNDLPLCKSLAMKRIKSVTGSLVLAACLGLTTSRALSQDITFNTLSALPKTGATVDTLDNLSLSKTQDNNLSEKLDTITTLTLSGAAAIMTGTDQTSGILGTAPNYVTKKDQAQFFGQAVPSGTTSTYTTDTSPYLSISSGGKATLTFSAPQSYLGLLWGSPDSYNTISFYDGATLVGSFTGTPIVNNYGYGYVNITATTTPFTSVALTSTGNSFEVDDIAHFGGSALASGSPGAPAPPLTACIAFAGVLVLQALRRRRVATV